MNWSPTLIRTVDLGYEQMLLLESHPRTRIKVIYGGVWLTEEGQLQDVFASSGDEVALKSRGLAVVEGLGYARVQVMEPPFGWRSVAASIRRLGDALYSAAHRLFSLPRSAAARSHSAV
jgi:Protein of unknown function (DUF2917)